MNTLESHHSSVHSSSQLQPAQELEMQEDKWYVFISMFCKVVKRYFNLCGMPVPQLSAGEMVLLRKSLENPDSPLSLPEKVECVLKYTQPVLQPSLEELQGSLHQLHSKLTKASTKSSSSCAEAEFFVEADSILSEHKEYIADPDREQIQLMRMELSWLTQVRAFLGLPNSDLTEHYVDEIDEYIAGYEQFKEQPQVSRGSKRQINLKHRKESVVRKRDSNSLGRKTQAKRLTLGGLGVAGTGNNHLASILLLKESENYDWILH